MKHVKNHINRGYEAYQNRINQLKEIRDYDNLRPMKELFKALIKWIMFPVFLGMVWTGVYSLDVKYLGRSDAVF